MLIALAIAGLLSALMMVGVDTSALASTPQPARNYAEAIATFDALRAREEPIVMPDGASLLYVHGHRTPRVLLLLHGLTNSPRQFRELAEQFHGQGANVLVPRLPLHGLRAGDVDVLRALTAEKLRDYADRSVDIANGLGDTVIVVGLSTGGNVAAWIAQHRADVARVVVIAPAIRLARIPSALAAPAMNLADRIPNVTIRQRPDTSRRHAYFGVSTRALAETFRFGASVVEEAQSTAPAVHDLVLVTNANDRTIDERAALALADAWMGHAGVVVRRARFEPALALPHDLIDVTQRCGMPDVVYPALIALVDKRDPPDLLAAHARCSATADSARRSAVAP